MKTQKLVRTIPTAFFLSLALLACAPLARAQTFQYWPLPTGANPYAPVILAKDGLFYGTLPASGASGDGQIFNVDTNGNFNFDLVDFDGSNGNQPQAPLVQASDGNFYGTTLLSQSGEGAIFQMTETIQAGVTTYGFNLLKNLGYADDTLPYGGLVQGRDGLLYGAAKGGMYPAYYGEVYRTDTNGNVTDLVEFTGTNALSAGTNAQGLHIADGMNPYYVQLVQATNGYFYGTCVSGGSSNLGTVFKMDTNGLVTTLVEFNGANGANPFTGLIQASDGNLYGTTVGGGANGLGTVFRLTPDGTLTTLVSFNGSTTEGQNCYSPLMQWSRDGLIYGQNITGGSYSVGEIWAMDLAGNITRVYSYGPHFPSDGYYPHNGLTAGSDGNLYGMCTAGGANGGGTFFQIVPVAPTVVSATCPVTNTTQVILVYSESVRASTATNPANYSLSYGGPVAAITANSATTYTLQLSSALVQANTNTVTINGVLSTIGAVPIAAATQVAINVPATTVRAQYNLGGTNNLVVLEAEDYDLNQPNGTRSWNFTTSPALLSPTDTNTTYSGTGAMEGDPTGGAQVGATTAIGSAPSSPRMDYLVTFNTTGTNYVWARGVGNTPYPWADVLGGSDSVSIGLDGGLTTRIDNFPTNWGYYWSNQQTNDTASTNIRITTPGLHVINVWIRATGFAIDKLLLTDNSSYAPTGLGPAESPVFVVPFAITVSRSSSGYLLYWPGGGTLLSCTNVNGNYQPVAGAASPFPLPLTNRANFYRVEQ
jgi:uncharacterized repeat protein (TIGR03803 family)